MDGYVSKTSQRFVHWPKKYNAVTYLDEVHAVGLYGETGAGYADQVGCLNKIDILNGTLGKAFGVQGGYITGNSTVIDAIRSVASGFIFTTSTSPVICAGALASVKWVKDHNELREVSIRNELSKTKRHCSEDREHTCLRKRHTHSTCEGRRCQDVVRSYERRCS